VSGECFPLLLVATEQLCRWATLSEERDRFTMYRADDVRTIASASWEEFDAALTRAGPGPVAPPCHGVRKAIEAWWAAQLRVIPKPADVYLYAHGSPGCVGPEGANRTRGGPVKHTTRSCAIDWRLG
jgi:hypothetical protein